MTDSPPEGTSAPVRPALDATTPSRRGHLARQALGAAVLLGLLADPLLRNPPWGVGLLLWMASFAILILLLLRQAGRPLSGESALWLTVAVFFASALSWRDADMLQFFDVLAMLTALVLLALSLGVFSVPGLAFARIRDLLRIAFDTGVGVATGLIPLLLRDAEFHTAPPTPRNGNIRRVGKALMITAPLLLLFTVLLANADPVFGSFFTFPDVDLGVVFSHVAIAGFFGWVVAGWLRRALISRPAAVGSEALPLPFTFGRTDVTIALGTLNVLFLAFVIVQIGWLFGGEALVRRTTGLSYAEYARHGFFELAGVAGLLLPVLLVAHALIPAEESGTLRSYRRLALPLVVLLGAMMLSAGARMRLYLQYYGLSSDRLYATAFMIWLALVFIWLALTVLRARPRTFAAGMLASGLAVLFVLNCLNPDALVARENLARGGAGRTGSAGADLRYLASLGGDAIPLLVSVLTAGDVDSATSAQADRCASARTVVHRWTGQGLERVGSHWTQWNIARNGAIQAVRAHEAELRQLACPVTPAAATTPPSTP